MTTAGVLADAGYAPLKAHILSVTGLAFYQDRDQELAQKLAPRLEAAGEPDCSSYLALLHDRGRGRRKWTPSSPS